MEAVRHSSWLKLTSLLFLVSFYHLNNIVRLKARACLQDCSFEEWLKIPEIILYDSR